MSVDKVNHQDAASLDPILVIIPCYNEAESIQAVVSSILSLGEGFHPLVVDDGSSDSSYELASQLTRCLQLPTNLGIGGAVQAGIRYAKRHGYQFCAQIDGDGQHISTDLLFLRDTIRSTNVDMVYGSRYLHKQGFQSTWLRRLGGTIIATTLRYAFAIKVTDPTSGLRLMNSRCIDLFSKNYPYDYPEPVSLAIALAASLRIAEIPVIMKARAFGTSSIAGVKKIGYMIRVISFIIIARVKKS